MVTWLLASGRSQGIVPSWRSSVIRLMIRCARAIGTIKGSAGLFGLDDIVAFTHVAESVLDKVRSDELNVTPELVALLLRSGDHMGELVDRIANGGELPATVQSEGRALVDQLSAYLEDGSIANAVAFVATVPAEYVLPHTTQGGGEVGTDHWHLSLRFGPDVFRNGMDPLSFIRYLATLGSIVHIVTLTDAIPSVSELDAENCHLGFEIAFKSDGDKAVIEGVFEFVREDCQIRILPPRSKITEYLGLIHDMNGENLRLGDILVSCGTLNRCRTGQCAAYSGRR